MNYTKHTLLFASAVVLGVVLGMATIALAQSITFDKDLDLQGTKKILNAANVGIGTATPAAHLDVNGNILIPNNTYVMARKSDTNTADILKLDGSNHIQIQAPGRIYYDTGNGSEHYFRQGGNIKVTIDTNGNVGIGTASPSEKLAIEYSAGVAQGIGIRESGAERVILKHYDGYGGYLSMRDDSGNEDVLIRTYETSHFMGGNVGIGTSTPVYKLDVAGTGQFTQPVLVGTPTVSGHAATKNYVDSAIVSTSDMLVKGNCTGAVTIDWSAGRTQHCVLTGNVTFTFSGGQSGASYKVILKQDGTGSRTVTWPASVRWGSMGTPYLTPVPSKTDYVGFVYNGVDSKYDGVAFNANY